MKVIILEKKYKNNINNFIKYELNLANINIENQIEEFYTFIDGMHPIEKEKTLIQNTWTKFMQNLLANGH